MDAILSRKNPTRDFVFRGVKANETFAQNFVQTFSELYMENKRMREKYNVWKVFKGSRVMYTSRTLPGVFCNVLCAVQNVYSAVQAVDQQLAAGHKL